MNRENGFEVDLEQFTLEELGSHSPRDIACWAAYNRVMLSKIILGRIMPLLQNESTPRRTDLSQRELEFETGAYPYIWNRLSSLQDRSRVPILHLLAYCSIFYGESCNQLIFGETKEISLNGRLAALLRLISYLPESQLAAITEKLEREYLPVNNPLYTLQTRMKERASLYSCELDKFYSDLTRVIINKQLLEQFLYEPQPAYFTGDIWDTMWLSQCSYTVLLYAAGKERISADYFLCQDYSKYATINGAPLTPEQRRFLSAWLCAKKEAQVRVYENLMNASVIPAHAFLEFDLENEEIRGDDEPDDYDDDD